MHVFINFDNKLVISTASHKCATLATLMTKAVLRARRYCSTIVVVMLYKNNMFSYIEYRIAELHYAFTTVLTEIDGARFTCCSKLCYHMYLSL